MLRFVGVVNFCLTFDRGEVLITRSNEKLASTHLVYNCQFTSSLCVCLHRLYTAKLKPKITQIVRSNIKFYFVFQQIEGGHLERDNQVNLSKSTFLM